jgi:2-dehydropantoate 2-reductase
VAVTRVQDEAMRIAVIGSGGIGAYFGGRLAASGHDVVFLARGAQLDAIRAHGLEVASVAGDVTVSPAQATDDIASIGPVDVVLLAVKTWQIDAVLDQLPALMRPGVAKIFAFIDGPGRIRHAGGPATLAFAEWDGTTSPRVAGLREAVAASGAVAPAPDDIWAELWSKMLFVVPFGTLGAALDRTIGQLRSAPSSRRLLEDAMREVETLARARGIRLPPSVVAGTMAFVDDQPEDATTSLQRDVLADKPSEIHAWTGAVVRLGNEAGVPVPIHRALLEVIVATHPGALPTRTLKDR